MNTSFVINRGLLYAKKFGPEILLGVGIVGGIGAAVMACRQTPKQIANKAETVEKAKELDDKYIQLRVIGEDDYKRQLGALYLEYAKKTAVIYGPSVAVGAVSIAAILASHGIMSKRVVAISAAYASLQETYLNYRDHVKRESPERDTEALHGFTVGEDGGETFDTERESEYARFFDEYSPQWQKSATMNLFFLRSVESAANDKLRANGHLFLNEVYDDLGIPRTSEGAVVGWIYSPSNDDSGEKLVDFGIYQSRNAMFVNGYERSVLLDFNVDGIIYDLI